MFHNQDTSLTGTPTQTPSQYLPEYLLGDPTISSPAQSARSLSVLTSYPWANVTSPSGQNTSTAAIPTKYARNTVMEKQCGPPIFGLFDQQSSSTIGPTNNMQISPSHQDSFFTSPIKSRETSFAANKSLLSQSSFHQSPAQLDPFYTQGESLQFDEELDETWVTVFGFPPSAVGYILQQFAQYGNILQHKMTSGNNWVHIHYQSKIQAKKALGKNGKIFGLNMMIGVQPCIDKKVMKEASKENFFSESTLSFTPTKSSSATDYNVSTLPTGMRPLTQAYRVAASANEVLTNR